ncbi:MAG: glycosyltransferase [Parvularculales bacterium]
MLYSRRVIINMYNETKQGLSDPLRILCAGNYDDRDQGRFFYSVIRKLTAGFNRTGHMVYPFSDRDIARASNIFHTRTLGVRQTNRKFLMACDHFKPDVIFLLHADIIKNETLREIRHKYPHVKIAYCSVDLPTQPSTRQKLHRFADVVDTLFLTSSGEDQRQFARPHNRVAFIPNPVDASCERYRAFENPTPKAHVFAAMTGESTDPRIKTAEDLRRALPDLSFSYWSFSGNPSLLGADYLEELSACRMGLNLSRSNDMPLYASDRIAQYTGNGLLTFTHGATGLQALYDDNEMVFFDDTEELIDKVRYYAENDSMARTIAARGHAKAHGVYNERIIARYILDVMTGDTSQSVCGHYLWPAEPLTV